MPSTASASPFDLGLAPAPDEVVRTLEHIPSAPRVLPRLKQLLSDGNSAMHEVVTMVRLDPGIAARVLQIGNSAYYSQGLRCYTVDEAVHRVGYNQIYELVATAVASQVLVRPLAAYGMEADELWQRSVACALAAEALAERLEVDRDIAYTIGLLHGVGQVAIDEWIYHHHPGLSFSPGPLPFETCLSERQVLGFHHGEAGAALLRLWEFPPVMSEPVRWQFLPRGTAAHYKFAALLHVAKWLRTAARDAAAPLNLPDNVLLRSLNLGLPDLHRLAVEVRARLANVSRLLDADLSDHLRLEFPGGDRTIQPTSIAR